MTGLFRHESILDDNNRCSHLAMCQRGEADTVNSGADSEPGIQLVETQLACLDLDASGDVTQFRLFNLARCKVRWRYLQSEAPFKAIVIN